MCRNGISSWISNHKSICLYEILSEALNLYDSCNLLLKAPYGVNSELHYFEKVIEVMELKRMQSCHYWSADACVSLKERFNFTSH